MVCQLSRPRYYFMDDDTEEAEDVIEIETLKLLNKSFIAYDEAEEPHLSYMEPLKVEEYYPAMNGLGAVSVSISMVESINTGITTNGFNAQTIKYVNAINTKQGELLEKTLNFLRNKYESGQPLTATLLRDKSNWPAVKQLVVRDELMKLQIGDVTDLPLTENEIEQIKLAIANKDLSDFNDKEIIDLINGILKPDEKAALQIFKDFKNDGIISPKLQQNKLQELKEMLKDIDLDKITAEQFKKLIDNFFEKIEIHHRTSISNDPTIQSDINNLDTLNTTTHDEKHTDPETGKVNYKKLTEEEMLDRQGELEALNKKRVLKNELMGLGITLAVAGGISFSIGFITEMARNGLAPDTLKKSFVAGAKTAGETSIITTANYAVGRTIGVHLTDSLTDIIRDRFAETIAEQSLVNICKMVSMGVTGTLCIAISAIYQFTKLKIAGYDTQFAINQVIKSASMSFAVLLLSIAAQGIWGGIAGTTVSITLGVVITGVEVIKVSKQRVFNENYPLFVIECYLPKEYLVA